MNERPEIIISGVSGRFSNCANVNQLKDKLYKGVDMTYDNEERWPKGIYGLPSKSGALLDLQNFDASFFGLTDEEADLIDPSTRCTIETTFEALCDAGLDPWNLDKRKVGLFHGQTNNEMNRYSVEFEGKSTNLQTQERLIAHIFNIKNGAFLYETACSSSFTALAQAFLHLTCGHIDLAIVSCANIMWTPAIALSYHRLGLTSQMGQCKFLDANASGYGRSETVATIILEKSCTAQRSHGQLINSVINCDGYKPQGITYPSWQSQASLISKCYKESSIDPTKLEYFECHGTGTEVGDMVEIKALWSVMGNGRSKLPLLLGSVKSNLGHSEAGSGLSSLIKCLIIFKLNSIPANLHYEKPSTHITELEKGFVAPVLKETPFKGQYIPINNFGFGGANCHIVLGRSIQNVQDKVSSSSREKPKMNHRSYIISCPRKGLKISSHELPSSSTKFPICFAFPGAGCQIDNMIQPFMGLKPFRESIEDSLSLVDSDGSKNVREMISNARQSHWKIFTLGIFQIAVVDTLKSLGIVPDIIVGHSFGEYFCAYADGVLSKAEVLDICYSVVQIISSIIAESQTFKSYSMISVALTWDELLPLIPNNLYPACFNTDNITLAGFTEDIVQFSNHLKVQNIFNRIIDSCGFAFHTQALGKIIELFRCKLTHFSNVYRKPSDKWIISHDSSMNSDKSLNIQKLCVEIIANTVQFEKACKSIPKNAICIEIAPRKFLTSLLKCNLTESLIVEVPLKLLSSGKFTININESDKQYLGFFHYNGYQVIPISGLIHLLWSKFASLTAHSTNDLAVCLERIKLHRLSLFDDQKLSFLIKFLPTNQGKYKFTIETYSDNLVIMTGLYPI
ncbi:LOW QUALITY PROTEIN: fatty acid synthase-like [Panonychus citri]|uniref:LOW QUALITY PROTEIN: fatty acid synthase-like n=1 Tax=Panonychus citri TaxID=50023 RepID=UPI002307E0EA|nr:LOW QUALITY PROTEIN: fatty acid synthase-like [Panonychus citri]